jgi:hypothetical protein
MVFAPCNFCSPPSARRQLNGRLLYALAKWTLAAYSFSQAQKGKHMVGTPKVIMSVLASCLIICSLNRHPTLGQDVPAADQPRPLADAVADFNARAAKNEIGRMQLPLTDAEVAAAIRGWIRDRTPVDDATYQVFQTIAATGTLPARANLRFTTRWTGYNGYDFDVWWIDLTVMKGERAGYTFRIRDQKIASRPSAP